ncbi:MAG: hypothetical protein IKJ35_02195, partial [Clostridia bacterium]|nr:hypothetical protein [Clostridia bacterium]
CACGEIKLEKIDKLPAHVHSFDEGVILTNPSETTEGVKVYTCACGEVKLEKIDKLPAHTHTFDDGEILTNPSELTEGVKVYTCACGETKLEKIDKLPAHVHSFDEGVVVVNPTHLTEGAKIYTCTCGVTRAETIAKTAEHTHGDWENHNDTQHKKVCACGDTVYEDHTLADGACGVCGKQSASGCAASVSGIALILPLCGAACLMLRKKKKQ